MSNLSAIAFVPARKNSKRLPGKNKRLLDGKPLFQYTLEAAINSGCFNKIVLTTDDEDIREMGSKIKGITVLERPEKYAGDGVRAKDVVLYHLKEMGEEFDYVSLLMPTSPFRDSEDIRNSFVILRKVNSNSLASVVRYDFHPSLAVKIKDNCLYSYFGEEFKWVRESVFEDAYHLNGAVFIVKMEYLLRTKSFVHDGTVTYLMDSLKSLDIDDEVALNYAEFLLKEKLV